jgi:hypothetical protein
MKCLHSSTQPMLKLVLNGNVSDFSARLDTNRILAKTGTTRVGCVIYIDCSCADHCNSDEENNIRDFVVPDVLAGSVEVSFRRRNKRAVRKVKAKVIPGFN